MLSKLEGSPANKYKLGARFDRIQGKINTPLKAQMDKTFKERAITQSSLVVYEHCSSV